MSEKRNGIPGSDHVITLVEKGKELLAFIEKEPVMQWLLHKVDKEIQAQATKEKEECKKVINDRLSNGHFGAVAVIVAVQICNVGGFDDLDSDAPLEKDLDCDLLVWRNRAIPADYMLTDECWAAEADFQFPGWWLVTLSSWDGHMLKSENMGSELDIGKIITIYELNSHEVAGAHSLYGPKPQAAKGQ